MSQHLETIGAFIDGERVDADALRAALAVEEGRAYLVELAAMREIVAMPAVVATAPTARPNAGRNFSSGNVPSAKFLLAAAALVALVGTAGFAIGRAEVERRVAIERAQANQAPAPTREVPAEAGVSWSSSTGSN
jgi:hypothetical protein